MMYSEMSSSITIHTHYMFVSLAFIKNTVFYCHIYYFSLFVETLCGDRAAKGIMFPVTFKGHGPHDVSFLMI